MQAFESGEAAQVIVCNIQQAPFTIKIEKSRGWSDASFKENWGQLNGY